MTARTTKPKLSDLSDADRAALLDELRADQQTAAEATADRQATARDAAIASLIGDRDHLRDCPGGRVEMYESRRPANPKKGTPPADVTVVRCIECGGSTVVDQPYATTIAEVDQATAAALETEEV